MVLLERCDSREAVLAAETLWIHQAQWLGWPIQNQKKLRSMLVPRVRDVARSFLAGLTRCDPLGIEPCDWCNALGGQHYEECPISAIEEIAELQQLDLLEREGLEGAPDKLDTSLEEAESRYEQFREDARVREIARREQMEMSSA